jgi:hypothetical protein
MLGAIGDFAEGRFTKPFTEGVLFGAEVGASDGGVTTVGYLAIIAANLSLIAIGFTGPSVGCGNCWGTVGVIGKAGLNGCGGVPSVGS